MHFKTKAPGEHWHQVLGVKDDATREEIKAAYKKLALLWHPDRHTDDKNLATTKFVEITTAYRIIMRERHFELANVPVNEAHPSRPSLQCRTSSEYIPPHTRSSLSTLDTFSSSSRRSSFESATTAPSTPRLSIRYTSTSCDTLSSMAHGHLNPYYRPLPPLSITNVLESHHFGDGTRSFTGRFPDRLAESRMPDLPRRFTDDSDFSSISDHIVMKSPPSPRTPRTPDQPRQPFPPLFKPSFASVGVGTSKEWRYSLSLTLEELFEGRVCPIRITRRLLSGQRMPIVLDVNVPPGCQPGAEIVFRGVGYERSPGVFQNIVFVIGQAHHDRFVRKDNDLLMDVKIPWAETLKHQEGRLCFPGVDGAPLSVRVALPTDTTRPLAGVQVVTGAGMPIWVRDKVAGRGNLVVHWKVETPQVSRWDTLRSVFTGFGRML